MADQKASDAGPLAPFVKALMEQMRDLYSRSEALRCLVESRGLFSREEYDRYREGALKVYDKTYQAELTRAIDAAQAESLFRVLEQHQDPKQ